MRQLSITTCQARNTFGLTAALAAYLQAQLQFTVTYIDDINWIERYRQIDSGRIDISWICGWPYVVRADRQLATVELLAAPVMVAERYQQRPIYFSDVVVRYDSPYLTFPDLRGQRWAFNEPGSQSGCHIVRHHLAQIGEVNGFFGTVIGSGGHLRSIKMVLDREVDGAAIDSTVWDWEVKQRPELLEQLRVIALLGPSGMPPLVIQKEVPAELRTAVRHILLTMHEHETGRAILAAGQISHFAAVNDSHYDDVRQMGRIARHVRMSLADSYYAEKVESSVELETMC